MKIKKITLLKTRYLIELDNDKSFYVYENTLSYFFLYEGMELDEDTVNEIIEKDNFYIGLKIAFRFLANPKTKFEVTRKLKEKNVNDEAIKRVIKYLESRNYIDDITYAKNYINDSQRFKKYGQYKIKNMLYQRGIDNFTIEDAFEYYDYELEFQNCLNLVQQKLKNNFDYNSKNKAIRSLYAKGYDFDTINSAISELESRYE